MRSRRIRTAIAALAGLTAAALLTPTVLDAPDARAASVIGVTTLSQEINGDGFCSLQEAIYAANLDDNRAPDPTDPGELVDTACVGGNGADVISLPPAVAFTVADPIDDADNVMGPTATPVVTSTITIEGHGARFQRHPLGRLTRAFAVDGGDLTLHELHVKGFGTKGGNGADGGGGGMGAGGAVFVREGALRIGWSTFEANTATGGRGGTPAGFDLGGGGGLSGNGGAGTFAGGGGGGARGDGGSGGASNQGGGGGGTVLSGQVITAGPPGGAGGSGDGLTGSVSGNDAVADGGGGGGGTQRVTPFDPFCGGDGGDGKYGGGGGGAGQDGSGGDGGFGGGGGGSGGHGGFGGGGGASHECSLFPNNGSAGLFGGDADIFYGGGGAGLGGAIFGDGAEIEILNSTFAGNVATKGTFGGGDANDGRGTGGAIFAHGGSVEIDGSTVVDNVASGSVGLGGGGVVVYGPGGTDASLRLRNTMVAGNGASECYVRGDVETAGSRSNLIMDSTKNVHEDAPCPGVVESADPQIGTLQINAPGLTPTFALAPTSPAIDAADPDTSPADDQRGITRPQGAAPDIGAYEAATMSPLTSIALDPPTPNGTNGWYTTAVGVSITASDPDGAVAQTRCALDPTPAPSAFGDLADAPCALTSVGADGAHTIVAASSDTEGNVEATLQQATFRIDATPPSLSPSLSSSTLVIGQTGVTASPNASDGGSGIAGASCGAVDTATPGVRSVNCTATDNAGNTANQSLPYVVQYRILGFFEPAPQSKWKAGQTVPIKIALGDGSGTRIGDAEAGALATSCRVVFSATGAQTQSAQCLKYDAATDTFLFPWKLAKNRTGIATIQVTVSYPGTTTTTILTASIEITR